MNKWFTIWAKENNISPSYNITCQLQLEEWAHKQGFNNEVEITLVSDFLLGLHNESNNISTNLPILPTNITIEENLRKSFYQAGISYSLLKQKINNSSILNVIRDFFLSHKNEIKEVLFNNSILESTGDCRGACQYNVGDRTEYRSYGY